MNVLPDRSQCVIGTAAIFRSNVEGTFSITKTKIGDSIRRKTGRQPAAKVLGKVLYHDFLVLSEESFEVGVEPIFWAKKDVAQQAGL